MTTTQEIINFWIGRFHEIGESTLTFFVNCDLPRRIFMEEYKKLPPIEQMPEKDKVEMKHYVISRFPEKTTEQKLEACKIIYTVGSLL